MDLAHRHLQQYCGLQQFRGFTKTYGQSLNGANLPKQCLGIYNQLTLIAAYSNKMHGLWQYNYSHSNRRELLNQHERTHWSQCPELMRGLYFVLEGKQVLDEVLVERTEATSKKPNKKGASLPTKIVPNWDNTSWRATEEDIMNATFLYIDFESLDNAASGMDLKMLWRNKMYDPTGKYTEWRGFLVVISK
jgi:hypothetical protein